MTQNYYEILGVQRGASDDAIDTAYRELAKEEHPDTSDHPDATERFRVVKEARDVLKHHPVLYDAVGHQKYVGVFGGTSTGLFEQDGATQSGSRSAGGPTDRDSAKTPTPGESTDPEQAPEETSSGSRGSSTSQGRSRTVRSSAGAGAGSARSASTPSFRWNLDILVPLLLGIVEMEIRLLWRGLKQFYISIPVFFLGVWGILWVLDPGGIVTAGLGIAMVLGVIYFGLQRPAIGITASTMGISMMLWYGTTAEATIADGLFGSTPFLAWFLLTTLYALFVSESA